MNEPPSSPRPASGADSEPREPNPPVSEEAAPEDGGGAEGSPTAPVPGGTASQPWAPPPPDAGPSTGIRFGGFWIRFAAYVVDSLILALIGILLGVAVGVLSGTSLDAAQGVLSLISLIVSVGYFVWFWARSGSTPGMSLLGLQVVRDADGGRISWVRAFLRYVGFLISTFVLFIGLIWVAFDRRKRGWHDLIAGTVVIRKPDVEITGGRKALMIGAIGCGCLLPILAIGGIVALLFTGPIIQDIFNDVADDLVRGPDGQVEQPVEISFASLRVGDCFELTDPSDPGTAGVRAVPCADEHVYEVFFVGNMPDGAFPGDTAVLTFANDNCVPAFEAYVGVPFEQSIWYASPVGPNENSWSEGDRHVTCQLHNQTETPVTGAARDSGE